jgi:N-acetylmuramoyl-L-alanine amidase
MFETKKLNHIDSYLLVLLPGLIISCVLSIVFGLSSLVSGEEGVPLHITNHEGISLDTKSYGTDEVKPEDIILSIDEIKLLSMNKSVEDKPEFIIHTITSGDTLSEIAKSYLGSAEDWDIIQEYNDNINPLSLPIGGKLKIPTDGVVKQSPQNPTQVSKQEPVSVTDNEFYLLARIINAEAGNQPYDGMIAVGNVVLNRVESPNFPNSIQSVIYQKGQFSPVANGAINKKPNAKSLKAAKEVLNGKRVVPSNVLYFYNPNTATSRWIFTREVVIQIGGHAFAL